MHMSVYVYVKFDALRNVSHELFRGFLLIGGLFAFMLVLTSFIMLVQTVLDADECTFAVYFLEYNSIMLPQQVNETFYDLFIINKVEDNIKKKIKP